MDERLPFLIDGYRIPNAKKRSMMKLFDALARIATFGTKRDFPVELPSKLLICNAGHLGDLIMTSALYPVIQARFPNAQLGVLTGAWGMAGVHGHPAISWTHTFDHVLLNRTGATRAERLKRHFRTRKRALSEIREVGYDVAIDLRFNPGNYFQFLRKCRIPVRIGYGSGGSGPFLTHCLPMDERPLHVTDRFFDLLAPLDVRSESKVRMKTSLPFIPGLPPAANGPYAVLHPGTYDAYKEWPIEHWRLLGKRLESEGLALVITGTGDDQAKLAETIRLGVPSAISLVGQLDWNGFVSAIHQAKVVVCVDTVAQHIAAAVGTPVVALMPGMIGFQWTPFGPYASGLTDQLPCVPCHRPAGCEGMECVRNLDAQRVHHEAITLIRQSNQGLEA